MLKACTKITLICLALVAAQASVGAQPTLADNLRQDSALQEATIIIMRSSLGGRDSTAVVRRGGFLLDIRIYVETYRAIRDANTLDNIQNRYNAAKAELLEPRLPTTIEELVSILETL